MDDFVQTRCARLKKNIQESFVSVKYTAHKKKIVDPAIKERIELKKKASLDDERQNDEKGIVDPRRQQELAMKRARYDVIKFGMSGLRSVEASKAKMEAAIALGARPFKKKSLNYKELKNERERVKKADKKKEHISGADKSLAKRKIRKMRKNYKDSGILGVYGKVDKKGGKS